MYKRANLSVLLLIFAFFTAFGACEITAGKIIYVAAIAATRSDFRRLDIRHTIDFPFGSKRTERMDIGVSDAGRLLASGLRHSAGQFGMELRRSHHFILRS